MDASLALKRLTNRAETVETYSETARENLDKALAIPGALLDGLMDAALTAEGEAKPWRALMRRIEHHGVREGLVRQCTESMEAVMQTESMSTSLVTNAARHAEQNGHRRFLSFTNGFEIDAEPAIAEEPTATPVEEPAPAATEEPAPAPTAKPKKVTPAQMRTLHVIDEGEVTIGQPDFRRPAYVGVKTGFTRPRLDMVEFAIGQGWATSVHVSNFSKSVTLTAAGKAIIAQ